MTPHRARDALEVRCLLDAIGGALDHPRYVAEMATCSPEGAEASLFIAYAYLAGAEAGFAAGHDCGVRCAAKYAAKVRRGEPKRRRPHR